MVRSRQARYTPEFKAEALRRVQQQIARDLGVTPKTLHNWLKATRPAAVERRTADERTELLTWRREVHQLRQERDILKKPRPSRQPERVTFAFIDAEAAFEARI